MALVTRRLTSEIGISGIVRAYFRTAQEDGQTIYSRAAQRHSGDQGRAIMHALHSNLLPPSAIHHALFLPNFTPSTIYPLPTPHVDGPETTVLGNLVVAGHEDLRVFEIRQLKVAILDPAEDGDGPEKVNGLTANGVDPTQDGMEEDFYDTGHAKVCRSQPRPDSLADISAHLCAMRRRGNSFC